ncbi:MAG: ribosome assembly factor SBDS [Candidatus Aenigmatarchaeota archaeon]
MVTLDKAIVAKIEKGDKRFEILVDPELAYEYREKKIQNIDIRKLLAVDNVFKDSKKGMPASKQDLINFFGTDDIEKIAKEIIENGEIQLTTEMRRKKLEAKKMEIAEFIAKNSIDPRTKVAHSVQRILNAMEEAKVHIDIFKKSEEQINDVVKAISSIIPISFEKIKLNIKIPAKHAAKCFGYLKSLNSNIEWLEDGSLHAFVEIPAGLKTEVFQRINNLTLGENEITIKD